MPYTSEIGLSQRGRSLGRPRLRAALLAGAFGLSACSADDVSRQAPPAAGPSSCGAGTHRSGGACLLDGPSPPGAVPCGPGTHLAGKQCELDAAGSAGAGGHGGEGAAGGSAGASAGSAGTSGGAAGAGGMSGGAAGIAGAAGGNVTCPKGQTECDGDCTHLSFDPKNCGACGALCSTDETCEAGACVPQCGSAMVLCDGGCVNPESDKDNCGQCGNACPEPYVCEQKKCTTHCPWGALECFGGCVFVSNDPSNCGGCGTHCPPGDACVGGQCQKICGTDPTVRLCNDTCTSVLFDPANCGACGVPCPTGDCYGGWCSPPIRFSAPLFAPIEHEGWRVVIDDFNGDGKPDVAGVEFEETDQSTGHFCLFVLMGDGTGGLAPAPVLPAKSEVRQAFGTGDLDGDGAAEIAVAQPSQSGGVVSILRLQPDGTFAIASTKQPSAGARAVFVGDSNHDGALDLITVGNGKLFTLVSKGNGVFDELAGTPWWAPGVLAVGDLNGDHVPDLIASTPGADGDHKWTDASVYLGSGDGTFSPGWGGGIGVSDPAATGDFDGDGRVDLALGCCAEPVACAVLGSEAGGFTSSSKSCWDFQRRLTTAVAADFDQDGHLDVAGVPGGAPYADLYGKNNVVILRGRGDGTFESPIAVPVAAGPRFVAAGDLNGDGRPDLVVASGDGHGVSVLLNVPP